MPWEFFEVKLFSSYGSYWFTIKMYTYIVLRNMAYCADFGPFLWRWLLALHPQGGSPTCFRLSLLPYSGFFIINCSTRLIQAQCDVLELSEIKEIVVLSVPRTTDPPRTCLVILTWSYRKLLILDPPTLLNQLPSCKRRWRLIKTGKLSSWSNPLGPLS